MSAPVSAPASTTVPVVAPTTTTTTTTTTSNTTTAPGDAEDNIHDFMKKALELEYAQHCLALDFKITGQRTLPQTIRLTHHDATLGEHIQKFRLLQETFMARTRPNLSPSDQLIFDGTHDLAPHLTPLFLPSAITTPQKRHRACLPRVPELESAMRAEETQRTLDAVRTQRRLLDAQLAHNKRRNLGPDALLRERRLVEQTAKRIARLESYYHQHLRPAMITLGRDLSVFDLILAGVDEVATDTATSDEDGADGSEDGEAPAYGSM
ncbi:hypothetical protein C8R43DRAFT_942282 [Mycena crocata]|nr:hypothetical protein C8R43DRAFT_942282 [Mycena crocata]